MNRLLVAALFVLAAPSVQASWSTVLLTKDRIDKGEIIGAYRSVWGTSPTNVYAAGAGGIIPFDGKKWARPAATLPPNSIFQGIWGTGPNDIYAVGIHGLVQNANGPLAYHFDGRRWVDIWPQLAAALPAGSSSVVLSKVAGAGRTAVYVSGNFVVDDRAAALVLRYDGSRWSPLLIEPGLFIWDILVQGRDDVYAVGSTTVLISPQKGATTYAALRRFDGTRWRDLSSTFNLGPGSEFSAVAAVGPGNIFLAGRQSEGRGSLERESLFFRGDGSSWQRTDAGNVSVQRLLDCGTRLCAIVISRGGYPRRLAYWENTQWRSIPLHRETEPESAWGTGGHVFAVGLGSQIFHFDGQGNIEEPASPDDGRKKQPETKLEF